ncbi:MAG: DUF4177 domain-containing protein [Defluviitaleaceae bacterium]|nr:DUF4177 domain-containing protein [Defluviitaleaceae bacterium]
MYEYKSEAIIANFNVTKKRKDADVCQASVVDEIINEMASEGWELVAHSMAVAYAVVDSAHTVLLTFKRLKG